MKIAKHLLRLSPILALLFLFLWLRSCRAERNQAARYSTNLQAGDKALRSYKLANGQLAHEKDLLTVTNKELKARVWMKDDSLRLLIKKIKHPVAAVKWETRFVRDTVYIPFVTPVPQPFLREFSKTEKWYSLTGSVDQEGVYIDEISIPNTQRLVVGHRNNKPVVSVSNTNPHLVTEAISGQHVSLPKKPWVLGAGATWNVYQPPSVGLFAGYKLLEF